MTWEQAERIAQAFHESYEHIAPYFGYETREETRVPWDEVPAQNRALMTATVFDLGRRRAIYANPCNAGCC